MNEGGSIVTLTYMGSERVLPNYNIMGVAKAALEASVRYAAMDMGKQGVRVNAISAGPIKTLAAWHRRFPQNLALERIKLSAAPQCYPRGSRYDHDGFVVSLRHRHYRRSYPRGLRLSYSGYAVLG